jgi:prolyl-tRNA synthetase
MQAGLLQTARAMRDEHTRSIETWEEFREFFTPQDEEKPEIHGGFALCHWHECEQVDELLKELKVTPRCLPLEEEASGGKCVFTGQPSTRRALFAKAY